jgi:hypothetical protein
MTADAPIIADASAAPYRTVAATIIARINFMQIASVIDPALARVHARAIG